MNCKHRIWMWAALWVGSIQAVAVPDAVAQPALPQPDAQQPAAEPSPGAKGADPSDWGPGLHSVLKNPQSISTPTAAPGAEPPLVIIPPARTTDNHVRPAVATSPVGALPSSSGVVLTAGTEDAASRAAALAAADLLSAALAPSKDKPLVGRAWTLLEAESAATGDRSRQMLIARAYWVLSATQADYGWAVDESARLEQITPSRNPLDAALLSSTQAAATARIQEARVAVVVAQQALADQLALPIGNPLPLTSDPPMVGAYRTYFDTLFAQRAAPSRLRLIDRTMPLRREVIETRAATVQAAASAVHFADDALAKPQPEIQIQSVLICHMELSHERRGFLAAVRDYNLDIAEYALNVADPTLPNDRLVGMLIPARPLGAASSVGHESDLSKPPADDPLMRAALPASDNRPRPARDPDRSPRVPGAAPVGPTASPGPGAPVYGGTSPAASGSSTTAGGDFPPYGRPPATSGTTAPPFGGTPAPLVGGATSPGGAPGLSTGSIGPPAGGFGPSPASAGPSISGGSPTADGSPRVPPLASPDSGTPPPSRGVSP